MIQLLAIQKPSYSGPQQACQNSSRWS